MKIKKLRIINYKLFNDVIIEMNDDVNIFVGENDSGKTTILEALTMVLTGRVNGGSLLSRFNLDWFNLEARNKFKDDIANGNTPEPPLIAIEAYLSDITEDEVLIKKFKGGNNSLREDVEGVKVECIFDNQYSSAYKQHLAEKKISDIPIEFYKINFRTFADPDYYVNTTSKKVACIDATRKDFGSALSRFVSGSISEYLDEDDVTLLRHAYRANRKEFTQSDAVKNLNEKLKENHNFEGKTISLNLRENEIDEWKNNMSISLDNIPLENSGYGTQNMFKAEVFLTQNTVVDILIVEEPENNLSYTNMSVLISKLSASSGKQLFISTHSSYVANKMGLQNLHLVSDKRTTPFTELKKDTYDYFVKLPGYNTLRVLLANKAILVEGPADELIIQRAYIDNYNKLPIEDGIDVVAVDGLAFERYCELAKLINKPITVVTDNDKNFERVVEKYKEYVGIVNLCVEENNTLNTLEPSVLEANKEKFEEFKKIIYKGTDIDSRNIDSIREFMTQNKTTWSMRVFASEKKITYPSYILKAIGVSVEEEI